MVEGQAQQQGAYLADLHPDTAAGIIDRLQLTIVHGNQRRISQSRQPRVEKRWHVSEVLSVLRQVEINAVSVSTSRPSTYCGGLSNSTKSRKSQDTAGAVSIKGNGHVPAGLQCPGV